MNLSRLPLVAPLLLVAPCLAAPTTPVKVLRVHSSAITSLAWSGDGKTIASGDKAGLVTLCDASTGKTRLRLKYSLAVASLAFSPDSRLLAVGREEGVRLLNARTGRLVRVLKTLVGDAQFSSDSRRLTVTALTEENKESNFEASIWDVATGKRLLARQWPQKQNEFDYFSSTISPSGRQAFVNTDGEMRLYNPRSITPVATWSLNPTENEPMIMQTAATKEGELVANAGGYVEGYGYFDVWNIKTHKRQWSQTISDWAQCVALSSNNKLLAVGTIYGTTDEGKPRPSGGDVFLYDIKTHKRTLTLRGHKDGVDVLAWSPDGKRIVSGSEDHTVRIWQLTPPR